MGRKAKESLHFSDPPDTTAAAWVNVISIIVDPFFFLFSFWFYFLVRAE